MRVDPQKHKDRDRTLCQPDLARSRGFGVGRPLCGLFHWWGGLPRTLAKRVTPVLARPYKFLCSDNMFNSTLLEEILKSIVQLVLLGVLGGAISWFYSRLQKNWELKIQILRDFTSLHGKFISLRYEFNSFYIKWSGKRSARFHHLTEEEIRLEKWEFFRQSCSLIGEIQGLRPMIVESFPKTAEDINYLFGKYQDWRRCIGGDKPILQEANGQNDESYDEIRNRFNRVVKEMRRRI